MPFGMSVRSGLDMQSARHIRGIESAEDQKKKTFFHPKAEEEECRIFKTKIIVYELMQIPLICIDKSGFSEDIPKIFGYTPAGVT